MTKMKEEKEDDYLLELFKVFNKDGNGYISTATFCSIWMQWPVKPMLMETDLSTTRIL